MALLDEGAEASSNMHNDKRKPLHFVFKRSNSADDLDFLAKLNVEFSISESAAAEDVGGHDEVFVREKAKSVRKMSKFV
jgi:hypothetical protein